MYGAQVVDDLLCAPFLVVMSTHDFWIVLTVTRDFLSGKKVLKRLASLDLHVYDHLYILGGHTPLRQ